MQRRFFCGLKQAIVGLAMILVAAGNASAQEFSDAQRAEVEKIIADYIAKNPDFIAEYLLANPEILLDVSDALRTKQEEQKAAARAYTLKSHREQIERHPMTPATGNPDADITVVEFFDYNCPYCKKVFKYMTELEQEDPNLRVVWKEYPILGEVSRFAAQVATAADRQGKYMEFHKLAMGGPGRLSSKPQVLKIAEKIGLDMEQLTRDLADPAIDKYLDETIRLAQALDITGTPAFVVGDEVIAGAISKQDMKRIIEMARKKKDS